MTTDQGEVCGDIGKSQITNKNDCKEAKVGLGDEYEFFDITNNPNPKTPRGCYLLFNATTAGINPYSVVWNPVEKGQPHDDTHAICLNHGKYILAHFSLSTSGLKELTIFYVNRF